MALPSTATPFPPTATLAPTATRAAQSLLDQAKRDLAERRAQHLIDILKPQLDQFTTADEQALAYAYLARAESQLGHFQLAAAYLEKAYALQPTAEYLFELAQAYDMGGDLRQALKKYQALLQLTEPEAERYRSTANQRFEEILKAMGLSAFLTPWASPTSGALTPTPARRIFPTPKGAVKVDWGTGVGPLSLSANAYMIFHFQPAQPLQYQSVQSLTFRLSKQNASGSTTLQLYLWNPNTGETGTISLQWADNLIQLPDRYVGTTGDIYAAIHNSGSQTINVDKAGFILTVRTADGSTVVYGLKQ